MDARRRNVRAAALCAAALAAALGGCSGKTRSADDYVTDTAPFDDAVGPSTYVPKVKMLLTGLPATAAEIQRVEADPNALPALVDGWMQLEPFRERMLSFFRNAFQQRLGSAALVSGSLGIPGFQVTGAGDLDDALRYDLEDSFALTAWQLVQEGRPFHETITTRRYMMTTALMAAMAYADMYAVPDSGGRRDLLDVVTQQDLLLDPLVVSSDTGAPLTLEESIAHFKPGGTGSWYWRIPVPGLTDDCRTWLQGGRVPVTVRDNPSSALFGVLFGGQGYPSDGTTCRQWGSDPNRTAPWVEAGDFADWRMVTIEQIPVYETTSLPSPFFWNLPALRTATTLRLRSPHVGFLGTPAWFGNWPTNESNQARVTANQALIVALGKSILPAAAVAPAPPTASDVAHATDPACAACHVTLDPLRQFFRQSYTFSYHEQRDYGVVAAPAAFLLDGMDERGTGVEDLARILARHPHFALGWAQKLQFWATSNVADEADPELQHVARAFEASGYDFRALVRAVFSSPLVTLARGTRTYRETRPTVGILRRDQLCAALSVRLGVPDACASRVAPGWNVRNVTQMIADDTYYRAAELPFLPRSPDLFFRNSVEEICARIADAVVDSGAAARYTSTSAESRAAAFEDMVTTIMGIPAGDLHARAVQLLDAHYATATGAGYGYPGAYALRSAFVLACTAPTSVFSGM